MTSPFEWQGKPSIFANDKHFTGTKKGKSASQVAQDTVEKIYQSGKNHGTLLGVSKNHSHYWTTEEFKQRRIK
jgi:hypothetical protein